MDSRYFTILAHPSGRLLFEREAYDVDMEEIIRKAADRGCVLELNSQPQRLDLTDVHCRQAQAEGGGHRGVLLRVVLRGVAPAFARAQHPPWNTGDPPWDP